MQSGQELACPPRHSEAVPLFTRVHGVIRSPRATFEAVARAPRWFGVITFTVLVTTGCSAILLRTEVGQLALLDRWERTASAFGRDIDDIQYAAMEDATQHGVAYAVVSSLVGGPLLSVGLSVAFFVAFRASRVAERPDQPVLAGRSAFADRPVAVTYRQLLAVVAHAASSWRCERSLRRRWHTRAKPWQVRRR